MTRTNETFVATGNTTYVSGASDDLVKDIVCIVFPFGALPPTATAAAASDKVVGSGRFPVPVQPDGVTTGSVTFALDGVGKEGKFEVLCGAVSAKGVTSSEDVRTPINVP